MFTLTNERGFSLEHKVQKNPLRTRADVERAALDLLVPLLPHLSPGRAGLHLSASGAVYPEPIADMEGFSRAMWAIVPMLAGKSDLVQPIWALWREGIAHGVDPDHPEYWGEIGDFDQRIVEMAVMGAGMCLAPDAFFFALPPTVQKNLHAWLCQINLHDMPTNNWRFFRVLVNAGFQLCGLPFSKERLDEDFALIESHYESDGWYYDYPDQREYYTPWGYHYYGLVYALAMEKLDPERARRYRERAAAFAPRFACWFTKDGAALPYGRSLTYRFAQGAFWSAMALVGVTAPGLSLGEIKGLLLRNLRWWLQKPIFTGDGLLSIGYGYPNLLMAEGYNAPGSPYWALKTFAVLALAEDHPFWTCEEKPYEPPHTLRDEGLRALIVRDAEGRQVQAFTAGNHATGHMFDEAKYEKFVYSTHFGFSVPKGLMWLSRGAFDCMLALSDDGVYWRPRYGCESFSIEEDCVVSAWRPFADVLVTTKIRPLGDGWHLRVHRVVTPRPLQAAEGGFAIRREMGFVKPETECEGVRCAAFAPWGLSGIAGLRGYERAELLAAEPNTNLLYPRTLLPTLHAALPAGETTLACLVIGLPQGDRQPWEHMPKEVFTDGPLG